MENTLMLDYIKELEEKIHTPETKADLHTHTLASDGAKSARALIDTARDRGVSILAITDHNTIGDKNGVSTYADEKGAETSDIFVKGNGVTVIPGVEVTSVVYPNKRSESGKISYGKSHEKIHMVVLGADRDPNLAFNKVLEMKHKSDVITDFGIFGYCNMQFGTNFSLNELKRMVQMEKFKNPNFFSFTNGQVAKICEARLKEKGKQVDRKYILNRINGDYGTQVRKVLDKRLVLDAEDMVTLAKCAGGTAIWAHPRMLAQKDLKDKMLDILTSKGLDGVEMFYSIKVGRDEDHTDYLKATPGPHKEAEMLWSGGSDFHTTAGAKNRVGAAWNHPIQASRLTVLDRLLENQKTRTTCLINGQDLPYGDSYYATKLLEKYQKEYEQTVGKAEKLVYFSEFDPRKETLGTKERVSFDSEFIAEAEEEEAQANNSWKENLQVAYDQLDSADKVVENDNDSEMGDGQ